MLTRVSAVVTQLRSRMKTVTYINQSTAARHLGIAFATFHDALERGDIRADALDGAGHELFRLDRLAELRATLVRNRPGLGARNLLNQIVC